ncbi:hypothetical protein OG917_04570 [Streptomyces sp. NBC_00388]
MVSSVPGPRGGFRRARGPEDVTLTGLAAAAEGPDQAFRCAGIRQQGPGAGTPDGYRGPCAVSQAMRTAGPARRRESRGRPSRRSRPRPSALPGCTRPCAPLVRRRPRLTHAAPRYRAGRTHPAILDNFLS